MASYLTSAVQTRAPGPCLSASLQRPGSKPSLLRKHCAKELCSSSTAGGCGRHSKAIRTKLSSGELRKKVSLLQCKARPSAEEGTLQDDHEDGTGIHQLPALYERGPVMSHDDDCEANDISRDAYIQGTAIALAIATALAVEPALAADSGKIDAFFTFNPVCPAADGLFRFGQRGALMIAGDENIENYRPLINDVLIRVRTEICILESFVRETATPFIREKGLGWVLPLRETSETYLAGVVFMVGANFILLGSTKVVAILSIYADLSLGLPARLLGRALSAAEDQGERRYATKMDKLMEKQMEEVKNAMSNTAMASEREEKVSKVNAEYAVKMEALKKELEESKVNRKETKLGQLATAAAAASVPLQIYGKASLTIRQILEIFDTFCSRYFVTFTVTYIAIKTAHYVVFPDFP